MPGTDFALRQQAYVRQQTMTPAEKPPASGFSFGDLLDIINPLQHIPVVSTVYRHLTGDKIATPEKIAGDTLYGGVTGFLCSVGDAIFTEATGKSVGDTVYAAVFGEDEPATTGVAANDTEPETATDIASFTTASPHQAAAAYRASGRLLAAY
jgi:hypothetical protein